MGGCPLLALSGHSECEPQMSAFGGKADIQRLSGHPLVHMSAFDPKRTSSWLELFVFILV